MSASLKGRKLDTAATNCYTGSEAQFNIYTETSYKQIPVASTLKKKQH